MVLKFQGLSYSLDFFSRSEVLEIRKEMQTLLNSIIDNPHRMNDSLQVMKKIWAVNDYLDGRVATDR